MLKTPSRGRPGSPRGCVLWLGACASSTTGDPTHPTGWVPGFAILSHVGRRSGSAYRTPINVFRRGDHYVCALTYGSDVDWVKNVVAAGGCSMRTRGRDVRLVEPEVIHDPELRLMPRPLGPLLGRLNRVTEVLRMRAA